MSPTTAARLTGLACVLTLATVGICASTGSPAAARPGTAAGTLTRTQTGPTLHVAPSGSDTNPGTSAAPLRTPQAAVDRLPASGGTVELANGTYRKQRIVLNGRHDVTVRPAAGAHPVLDGTGLAPVDDGSGMIEIRNSSRITVQGLGVTGYRTSSLEQTPMGIYVTGSGDRIDILGNHVYRLGNVNHTRGSFDINAHGIAVYGTSATTPLTHVRIAGNEVDHLALGASESVVVNGDVDGWSITGNSVHDDNNIGIDAIGFEETISGRARYSEVNRARNGVIRGNTVNRISAAGNPSYWEDGSYCRCADGIYVDGGTAITISGNRVRTSDIGIEVAAENPRGRTNAITVTRNTVTGSAYVGMTIGGYAPDRGEAYDVTVAGNTLFGDNTLHDGMPELMLQYKVHRTTITGNHFTATNAGDPELVARVPHAGTVAQNAGVVVDHNVYSAPGSAGDAGFSWLGRDLTGFATWQRVSGEDRHSTFTTRR